MQLQLSPAHPDFGRVVLLNWKPGFAHELINCTKDTYTGTRLTTGYKPKLEVLGVTKGDTDLENVSATA